METSPTPTTGMATTKPKARKQARKRPLPPDVNSRNLAIEKRRRQDMNRTFLDIARCVPALATSKRLTKNLIVLESLQHLQRQRALCIAAGREIHELLSAHNDLIAEVNTLRSQLAIPVRNAPRSPSTAFLSLMNVENQTCGEFPDGFASPGSAIDNNELQPSSLPRLSIGPIQDRPIRMSAHDGQVNYHDGIHEVGPPEDWQAQASASQPIYPSSSNVQTAFASDIDRWEFDVAGLDSGLPWEDLPETHMLPWEEAGDEHGYPNSAFDPYLRSSFGTLCADGGL